MRDFDKFSAVLTFEERCGLYCAARHIKGASSAVIAEAAGIEKSVASRLISDKSAKYKEVKDLFKKMGSDEFCIKFLTPEIEKSVNTALIVIEAMRADHAAERRKKIEQKAAQRKMRKRGLLRRGS